ncbi:MAG: DMT family transporter [Holophagaceae bacterium]|nr:DMT family transporter [Holophagaceae bacterium]
MTFDGVLVGQASAFTAAFLWAITVTVLTFAARRIGPQVVNAMRLALAAMLLVLLHWLFLGTPWPMGVGLSGTAWLLLSGLLGFAMADGLGLESFVEIGPHLGMLMQTLAPVLSATLAWVFLGQNLSWSKGAAILVTLSGIAMVVAGPDPRPSGRSRAWGLLLGLGAAVGQALGQFTSLKGMASGVEPFSALVVRVGAGAVGSMAYLALRGNLRLSSSAWADRRILAQMLTGTALGPILGGFLAMYAIAHAPLGPVSTLLAIVPIFLLPLSWIFFHEPITLRAVVGTLLTVGGAAGLFLVN